MSRTKYLTIDTRFYTDQYNFPFSEYYVELPHKIHKVKSFTVVNIEIPISFYNVCDALCNNSMKIMNMTNKNEKPITIKLPDNNYTFDTIRDSIDNKLKKNGIDDLYVDMSNNKFKLSTKKDDYVIDLENRIPAYQYNYKLHTMLGLKSSKIYVVNNTRNKEESKKPDNESNESNLCSPDTICNLLNPRYLYLELIECDHDKNEDNEHLFSSSLLGSHISKHIIARIVTDYRTFPFGTILPANLFNGFLVSNTRLYSCPMKLKHLHP